MPFLTSFGMLGHGKVYSAGVGENFQLGFGNDHSVDEPTMIPGLASEVITKVSAGWGHSLALTSTLRKISSCSNWSAQFLTQFSQKMDKSFLGDGMKKDNVDTYDGLLLVLFIFGTHSCVL